MKILLFTGKWKNHNIKICQINRHIMNFIVLLMHPITYRRFRILWNKNHENLKMQLCTPLWILVVFWFPVECLVVWITYILYLSLIYFHLPQEWILILKRRELTNIEFFFLNKIMNLNNVVGTLLILRLIYALFGDFLMKRSWKEFKVT